MPVAGMLKTHQLRPRKSWNDACIHPLCAGSATMAFVALFIKLAAGRVVLSFEIHRSPIGADSPALI
jgi:hypothetical protein